MLFSWKDWSTPGIGDNMKLSFLRLLIASMNSLLFFPFLPFFFLFSRKREREKDLWSSIVSYGHSSRHDNPTSIYLTIQCIPSNVSSVPIISLLRALPYRCSPCVMLNSLSSSIRYTHDPLTRLLSSFFPLLETRVERRDFNSRFKQNCGTRYRITESNFHRLLSRSHLLSFFFQREIRFLLLLQFYQLYINFETI